MGGFRYVDDSATNVLKGGIKKNSYKFIFKLALNIFLFLLSISVYLLLAQFNDTLSFLILLTILYIGIYRYIFCYIGFYYEPWSLSNLELRNILFIRKLIRPSNYSSNHYVFTSWDYLIIVLIFLGGWCISVLDSNINIYIFTCIFLSTNTSLFVISKLFSETKLNFFKIIFNIAMGLVGGFVLILWIYSTFLEAADTFKWINVNVIILLLMMIILLYWLLVEILYLLTLIINQIYRVIYEPVSLGENRKVFLITGLHGSGKTFFALKNHDYFNAALENRIIENLSFIGKINYKSWRNSMLNKYSTKDTIWISCNGKTVDEIFRETINCIETVSNYPKYRKVVMKLMNKYIQISDIDKYSDYVFSNNVIQNLVLDDIERFVAINSFREESKQLTKLFLKLNEYYNIILIANVEDDGNEGKELLYSLNKFPYKKLDIELLDSVKITYKERTDCNAIIDECIRHDIGPEKLTEILNLEENGGLRHLFNILDEYDQYGYRANKKKKIKFKNEVELEEFLKSISKVKQDAYYYG